MKLKMKIAFKKRYLNISLVLGIVWLIFGLLEIFIKETPYWTDYATLVISVAYLVLFFYQKQKKYLTIENGTIAINGYSGKQLNLNEIKQIKKFAGDYILKTDQKELTINTQIIDQKSLITLNETLEKLNVEWK